MKQSVGKKSCLVGQALEVNYFRGKNYLEVKIQKYIYIYNYNNYLNQKQHSYIERDIVHIINLYICMYQLGIDVGSSTVARGVVSLVLGYLNNLVIEMAFLIQVILHPHPTTYSIFVRSRRLILWLICREIQRKSCRSSFLGHAVSTV